ncbi:acetoacetate--CoA ligase [Marinovum sp. 2_MG-2023]|nr:MULTISPECIES: acetoacetate--CoA ligase [unclassified Marinovum]MDO6732801.1 acetoacetate--CoA ligase [Marinovum sp. 2_MG-2023]MDO6782070.1 acetoacetate--CoA ligase [Marinovum sp. 1_MG-2023]
MTETTMWTPEESRALSTGLAKFALLQGFDPKNYVALHRWSVSDLGGFWSALWDFCGVPGDKGARAFVPDDTAWMTGARFFPDAQLNLAETMLQGADGDTVVIEADENGQQRFFTRGALRAAVAQAADGLVAAGVTPGDRVAGVLPNRFEALVASLAALTVGAVWTACSPDFGAAAIIDRIGQVAPKVLFAATRYRYAGRDHDIGDRIAEVMAGVPSLAVLVLSGPGGMPGGKGIRQEDFGTAQKLEFRRLPFDHPAYILYTSGTTGAPKAIVHRAGGVVLQHLKEHVLHGDVRVGDRVLWYTNTAWMMYPWMVSALAAGAAIVLYDGSPILKTPAGLDCAPLWSLIESAGISHMGVSPKYLATLQAEEFQPGARHDLASLRALLVCGAPCLPHQFDWVYAAVKPDMMFASISGGTEILGCFLIGSPMHPVRRGQLTVPALGMAVQVLDDRGSPVIGRRGDLVCTEPFPSMPLTFWGEDGEARYHATYFSDRSQVWTHGDVAELTATGGGYVHGRSDNTLKPGGVRIGISEIYAVCETFPELDDFLAFGADHAGDEEVVLALKPAEGKPLSADLLRGLRARIRAEASPRHVPARIHLVSEIPYTINGKRVEGAARATVNSGEVRNLASLANPACLAEYRALRREDAL